MAGVVRSSMKESSSSSLLPSLSFLIFGGCIGRYSCGAPLPCVEESCAGFWETNIAYVALSDADGGDAFFVA